MSNKDNRVSPVGTFIYPHLNAPNTHFGAPGNYEVGLRLEGEEAANFQAELQGYYDQAHQEFKKANPKKKNLQARPLSIKPVVDDEGNETGEVDFRFKMKAEITLRTGETVELRPVLADSKGDKFDASEIRLGTGTKGRISYQLNPYSNTAFGVSLQLKGAQIIDPVEASGGVSFDPVEDGWTAEAAGVGEAKGDF